MGTMEGRQRTIISCKEELDDLFAAFEEVAGAMGWEKDKWPLLVQSALTGKALSVALALDGGNKDYEIMKLKRYSKFTRLHRSFTELNLEMLKRALDRTFF